MLAVNVYLVLTILSALFIVCYGIVFFPALSYR